MRERVVTAALFSTRLFLRGRFGLRHEFLQEFRRLTQAGILLLGFEDRSTVTVGGAVRAGTRLLAVLRSLDAPFADVTVPGADDLRTPDPSERCLRLLRKSQAVHGFEPTNSYLFDPAPDTGPQLGPRPIRIRSVVGVLERAGVEIACSHLHRAVNLMLVTQANHRENRKPVLKALPTN